MTDKANGILKPLGLAAYMDTVKGSPRYFDPSPLYNLTAFISYLPHRYRTNEKLRESDEVYGFRTRVFLHLRTGIRCEYDIHEDYSDGEEYKIREIFVMSTDDKKMEVLDVDYQNKFVITQSGNRSFEQLKRHVDETD